MFKQAIKFSVIGFLMFRLVPESAAAQDFESTKLLAEQGDPEAQTLLGTMYAYGLGIPEDHGKALKWLHEAAEQGYADGQLSLAYLYLSLIHI